MWLVRVSDRHNMSAWLIDASGIQHPILSFHDTLVLH